MHLLDNAKINSPTTGTAVVVRKFLDANAGSIIDGSVMLLQWFNRTDGRAGRVITASRITTFPATLKRAE